jgi:hypothetical protein
VEEARRGRIRAHWESLEPANREELRARAIAGANPFLHGRYVQSRDNPDLSDQYLQMILDAHIATLLDGEGRSA